MTRVKHPRYNRYESNPYACPPPTYDASICGDCEGPTGQTGQLG